MALIWLVVAGCGLTKWFQSVVMVVVVAVVARRVLVAKIESMIFMLVDWPLVVVGEFTKLGSSQEVATQVEVVQQNRVGHGDNDNKCPWEGGKLV